MKKTLLQHSSNVCVELSVCSVGVLVGDIGILRAVVVVNKALNVGENDLVVF